MGIRGMFTAASGMIGNQFLVDTIANNLANVNTTGFKKARVNFQDLLYQHIRPAGTSVTTGINVPTGISVGHGTRVASTERIFSQGDFRVTENPLDIVIMGRGFFRIQRDDGTTGYTRDGSFKRDETGRIVTAEGLPLLPEITIPEDATSVAVGRDGSVSVLVAGQEASQEIGQIDLALFVNPAGLLADGSNMYLETDASGAPTVVTPGLEGAGQLLNGVLEASNVQIVEELVNLIIAQRAFEVNSRVVQTTDEMLQSANNIRR